jgi:glycerol uptake facilitator-like aquaporin
MAIGKTFNHFLLMHGSNLLPGVSTGAWVAGGVSGGHINPAVNDPKTFWTSQS